MHPAVSQWPHRLEDLSHPGCEGTKWNASYHHATNDAEYYYNLDDMTVCIYIYIIECWWCTYKKSSWSFMMLFGMLVCFFHYTSALKGSQQTIETALPSRTSALIAVQEQVPLAWCAWNPFRLQERLVYQDKGIIARLNGKSTLNPLKSIGIRFVNLQYGSPGRPPPQTAPKRHTNSLGYRFAHWLLEKLSNVYWSSTTVFLDESIE